MTAHGLLLLLLAATSHDTPTCGPVSEWLRIVAVAGAEVNPDASTSKRERWEAGDRWADVVYQRSQVCVVDFGTYHRDR